MTGFGRALDGFACRVAGHIWVPHADTEGVLVCTRCGVGDDSEARRRWGRPIRRRRAERTAPIVPEERPWLEPPFMTSEFQ